jgi:hypothetical protein
LVTLTLTTSGGSCGSVFATKNLSVNPSPAPVVSGNTGPCRDVLHLLPAYTYSTPLAGANTYSWSVTNGTISGPSNGNSILVYWDGLTGSGSVSVTETMAVTGCIKVANLNVSVNPSAPAAAGAIAGPVNVCYAQTGVTYSIAAVPNASNYVWNVPAGVTITSGTGTNSITVDFAAGAASPRLIQVYPENGCGPGLPVATKNVSIYPQMVAGTVTGKRRSVTTRMYLPLYRRHRQQEATERSPTCGSGQRTWRQCREEQDGLTWQDQMSQQ